MVPHRGTVNFMVLEAFYIRRLRHGRCVVEKVFGFLKQSWGELLVESELSVTFLPNMITACALLSNVLPGQDAEDVAALLRVMEEEGLNGEFDDGDYGPIDEPRGNMEEVVVTSVGEKRRDIAISLAASS